MNATTDEFWTNIASLPMTDAAAQAYLARYPDIAADPIYRNSPLDHYANIGRFQGRVWGEPAEQSPTASGPMPADLAAASAINPVASVPAATYGNTADDWSAYRQAAQAQTVGLNRMPFIFSNYADIPASASVSNALFYPSSSGGQTTTNPLFASFVK